MQLAAVETQLTLCQKHRTWLQEAARSRWHAHTEVCVSTCSARRSLSRSHPQAHHQALHWRAEATAAAAAVLVKQMPQQQLALPAGRCSSSCPSWHCRPQGRAAGMQQQLHPTPFISSSSICHHTSSHISSSIGQSGCLDAPQSRCRLS